MANENRAELGADGTVRKSHYGEGRQPWDDMVDIGIAHGFAAGSILKYLRRSKEPQHSIDSARWYWRALARLSEDTAYDWHDEARWALAALRSTLTFSEKGLLDE